MATRNPRTFYTESTAQYSRQMVRWQRRRNAITLLRVALFVLLLWDVYGIASLESRFWIAAAGVTVAGFVVLGILDNRVVQKIRYYRTLCEACRTELEALADRWEGLPTGSEFLEAAHPYAADLDLFGEDSLFRRLNRTVTPAGKQRLAEWLLHPCREATEIQERQQAAEELAAQPEWCLRFRANGTVGRKPQGKEPDEQAWNAFRNEPDIFGAGVWRWLSVVLPVLTIGAWVGVTLDSDTWSWPAVVLSLVQLGIVGACAKRVGAMQRRLETFLGMMGSYTALVRQLSESRFFSPLMQAQHDRVTASGCAALPAFSQLQRILDGLEQRGNFFAVVVTNALWMRDVHLVRRLEKWRSTYGVHIESWLSAVTNTDVLVSLATFRFGHPEYTVPEITDEVLLAASGVGHPMLPRDGMVTNDLTVNSLHEFYIVTGANMAGKSTFLRTIGVSLVLALAGSVVCATRFRCTPMMLFTSMRTTDNLSKGTSYFHAELLRLKALVELAEREERLFLILDEMLKGTNSQDKLQGSLRFLEKLRSLRVAGLVATHDLALGELQERYPEHFRNVCFEITHRGREIVYDYKLHPGVSRHMNATILLRQMGLIDSHDSQDETMS